MEFVEGLVQLGIYGVVIAAVAMMTPRVGNGVKALVGLVSGRKDKIPAAE